MRPTQYALDVTTGLMETHGMNVVFASSGSWPTDHIDLTASGHNSSKMAGSARDLRSWLYDTNPDIVFFACAEPSVHAATEAALICAALPMTPVVVFCKDPSPDFLVRAMRMGIREVLTEDTETAVLEAIARQAVRRHANGVEPNTNGGILGFMAAKGGDGSTFLAANFAWELVKLTEKRVILLDLASPFGDLDIYLASTRQPHDLADFCSEIERLDNALVETMVFHVNDSLDLIPSATTFERFVDISSDHIVSLIAQLKLNYDFVIIDLGSRIDRLNLPVLEKLNQLVIVATPEMPSIRRAGQIVELWESMDLDKTEISLVLNRVTRKSPLTEQAIENTIGLKVEERFPDITDEVRASLLRGRPVVDLFPKSAGSKKISNWVAAYFGLEIEGTSLWRRLKKR